MKSVVALIFLVLLCLTHHLTHAQNAPVGGGGSCNQSLEPDGTVAQQQAYDNGLYTCLSGGTWTPEAIIIGSTLANGSAATCTSSVNAGMIEYTGGVFDYCNGSSFLALSTENPSAGTIGATSGVLVELTAGTQDLPSLTFEEDTNTGIYQPATHTMAVASAGTERVAFDASGNINLLGATAAYEINSVAQLVIPAADPTGATLAIGGNVLVSDSHTTGTTGENNTGIGYDALQFNTTGSNNTALGAYALEYATTGTQNTATGAYAMQGVSTTPLTGSGNTAAGYEALMTIQGAAADNTAVGMQALENLTTGSSNTAVGYEAMQNETTHSGNIAYGYEAMLNNAAGDNIGIGYQALYQNSGGNNVAAGYQAMYITSSGADNVAVGNYAMTSSTASDSVAIGHQALENATATGTAVGYQALMNATGGQNDALGYQAGLNITTGSSNVALGNQAMVGVSATPLTGSYNIAAGDSALFHAEGAASGNTAVGQAAMGSLYGYGPVSGSDNTAIGWTALNGISSGTGNVGFGSQAGLDISTGSSNVAVGVNALLIATTGTNSALGYEAGADITTGHDNTLLGYEAGLAVTGNSNIVVGEDTSGRLTTGGSNIWIGNALTKLTGTSSNQLDIGDLILGTFASSEVAIGTTTFQGTGLSVSGNIWAGATELMSDARLKKNIRTLEGGLEGIEKLRGVTYEWRPVFERAVGKDMSLDIGQRQMGVIAQEVAMAFPEAVTVGAGGVESVNYDSLIAPLIEAIKAQQKEIAALTRAAKRQQGEIDPLAEWVKVRQQQIDDLKQQLAHSAP
jgi:hypothetical protein